MCPSDAYFLHHKMDIPKMRITLSLLCTKSECLSDHTMSTFDV